ncbi:methylation-associated defense system restriction endonuclease subunit S MAD5 [Aeromonas sp. 25-248]|uniref:methylation-associated defense system restriction endonuclease subunit S MAD5 n=1 Tax=Aeromonas caviae TaxID=648 RepID=UPI002B49CBF5|nr:hypothetical protein [Aeromonas caviae]
MNAIKFKIVRSTWLEEGGRRLDCNPYMSGALEARDALHALDCPKILLPEVTDSIFHAGREGRVWVDDRKFGVPFLGSTDILSVDLSSQPLLAKFQVDRNPLFTLKRGWTLITRSGTIGRMAYVRPDMDGMACSEHVLRVVPNAEKIPPGYLYAFLSSRYGLPQVISGTYGAIIQHIEPGHLSKLPIPRMGSAFEKAIHATVERAAFARARGQELYALATADALAGCGLDDVPPNSWRASKEVGFVTCLGFGSSLRALNHDPRMLALIEKIRKNRTIDIESALVRPPFRPNRFSRIDAESGHGIQLVGQKEMFFAQWSGRCISFKGIPDKDEVVPPAGTIAVACIGTLGENEVFGRCIRVRQGQEKFALSDNVLQLRPDEVVVPSGYLFALLRSEVYFRIFRCLSVGGKQQVLHPELVRTVPIPIIDASAMAKIDSLIAEGDELLDLSNDLFMEAASLVEARISEGRA